MIEDMSPVARRVVAMGLLVLAALLLLQFVVMPLVGAIGDARDELAALRTRHARLSAAAKRLMPDSSTMPPGLAISVADPTAAGQRLQALVAGSATTSGVTLVPAPAHALPGEPRLVGSEISATGSEAALTNFASLLEHGTPVIRFRHWQLTSMDGQPTTMRFSGLAVVAWQPVS